MSYISQITLNNSKLGDIKDREIDEVVANVLAVHEERLDDNESRLDDINDKINNIPIESNIGEGSVIINGIGNSASGPYSLAEGFQTNASGSVSHAEGRNTKASGFIAHAEGSSTTASGENSHAEGADTRAHGNTSHAEGWSTKASGFIAHAEGSSTTASGENSHAEGASTKASGTASHAEGWSTKASGFIAHAEGNNTTASGYVSHAEGYLTTASENASHAEGSGSVASGPVSHAEGSSTTASGYVSHAEGYLTTASSNASHAEGMDTIASGSTSHAEGYSSSAVGTASHAEGDRTSASGYASHAEGSSSRATGGSSHAEGSNTTASGIASHAEGSSSKAYGSYSHAEGSGSVASGPVSHAEGSSTTASGTASHAEGYLNYDDSSFIHTVGVGNDEEEIRMNAHTITRDGKHYILGVGGYQGQATAGSRDLASVIKASSNIQYLTDNDFMYIYGIPIPGTSAYIAALYIDDFPDPQSIAEEEGYTNFQGYINAICTDPSAAATVGTNIFVPSVDTIEYEGSEYRIWMCFNYDDDWHSNDLCGLAPMDLDYDTLYNNSLEANINNSYSPFVAIGHHETTGTTISYTDDMDTDYQLICVKILEMPNNPVDPSHASTFDTIWLDDYHRYGLYIDLLNSGCETIDEWISAVKNQETGIDAWSSAGEIEYDGVTYKLYEDDGELYGWLLPMDVTYQDVYQHSIECDGWNYETPYNPFIVKYDVDNDTAIYEGEPTTNHKTTVITLD